MSAITLHIGDVFEQLAKIPDGSIDLIVTSPPFLALRSYLPDDHPDKGKEIGSESGPAAFLDTMMALSAEWGRVLAPHGSLCVELGDTYSGSGGAGGDYNADGLRDGQQKFSGSAAKRAALGGGDNERPSRSGRGDGWPMSKSKTMLDTLYPACLAYGANLLSGEVSPAGRWRIRNLIVWARPNPPVGALGDKFRPATSYITVACKSPKRWFDLDAVRGAPSPKTNARTAKGVDRQQSAGKSADDERRGGNFSTLDTLHEVGGSPPLDWHADDHPEDGDWLWKMSPQGFAGSHYATFPMALPTRLIKAMCPERVCTVCGVPSERIAETTNAVGKATGRRTWREDGTDGVGAGHSGHITESVSNAPTAQRVTTGWTDCGHNAWRTGRVLDPFAGSGTTLVAAHNESRDAIGVDLDSRNVAMVEDRLGPLVAACDLTVNTTEVAAA
jgi:site-specific DNA-methyltransferase (adenine-specific)